MWRAFGASAGGWRDSLEVLGSVVFLGRVGPGSVVVLEGAIPPGNLDEGDEAVSAPGPR